MEEDDAQSRAMDLEEKLKALEEKVKKFGEAVKETTPEAPFQLGTRLARLYPAGGGPDEAVLPDAPSRATPKKKRRPKAISTGKVISPEQRALGNLLREIAEISTRNPMLYNYSKIAELLQKRSKYNNFSHRQMRRDVAAAINWQIRILQRRPVQLWQELLHIEPPPALTKSALKEKAFETLRHELLARNR
jgi:hypothetical protein